MKHTIPAKHLHTTPVVHEHHAENVLVRLVNGNAVAEFIANTDKKGLDAHMCCNAW